MRDHKQSARVATITPCMRRMDYAMPRGYPRARRVAVQWQDALRVSAFSFPPHA